MITKNQGIFLRFAMVGAGVGLCYVLLYLSFLALGLFQPLANLAAFLAAVLLQYVAQTSWTFRRPLGLPNQISRFLFTISIGLLVSALITGKIGLALNWPDWISAVVVTVVLPLQNYLLFRVWVFSDSTKYVGR